MVSKKLFSFGKGRRFSTGSAAADAVDSIQSSSSSSASSSHAETDANEDLVSHVTTSLQSASIFSKGRTTLGTGNSSSLSDRSSWFGKHPDSRTLEGRDVSSECTVGKPLRVLDYERLTSLNPVIEEEDTAGTEHQDDYGASGSMRKRGSFGSGRKLERLPTASLEVVEAELRRLDEDLIALMDDIHQNVLNISKAVIQAIEFIKKFLQDTSRVSVTVTTTHSAALRSITKVVSHFVDNLLAGTAFQNSRAILLKAYLGLLQRLNINVFDEPMENLHTLPMMRNFAIDDKCHLPNMDKISSIIDEIVRWDPSCISDQDGAFIAPILRGLNGKSAILSVMFGVPNPQQEHHDMVRALFSTFPDLHFFCVKDYIKPCADTLPATNLTTPKPMQSTSKPSFIPPYRVPTNALKPPISMSISTEESQKITGTLGGYLYPKIAKNDPKFAQFSGSTFAITCAHVVLSENQEYPHVSTPSTLLQTIYKNRLLEEREQYQESSAEYESFSQEEYRVESNLQWQAEHKFGQVVWGERSVINKSLSDFAIIKVNSEFTCENYLGDDLNGLPDPSLRFKNLYVREKLNSIKPGTKVFKIGATSNYTTGKVNGTKLVYWSDNRIQSTEFVVSSPQPLFADAGDSGAWILSKLENKLGLGVCGILHSYDGELRQFGIFTPMSTILDRLHSVTGVEWDINPPVSF